MELEFKFFIEDEWRHLTMGEVLEFSVDGNELTYYPRRIWTGVVTKGGDKLFEHDIVRYKGKEYEICYSAYYGCFGLSKPYEFKDGKGCLLGHGGSSTRYSPYLWNWLATKVEFIEEAEV